MDFLFLNPLLKQQVLCLTHNPGVYLFLNTQREVLYVGKARNLKKRVRSYFGKQPQSRRIASLMQQVNYLETTATETENQALLLESNLIKQLKPRYNILLRDDKSYPYIILSDHPNFPRLSFYRGIRLKNYQHFGPYPSITAVRETLSLLQKLFRLRSCQDTFFRNRTRPCLQYQIKRCTAPCVGLISPERYKEDVKHTILFLKGKDRYVIESIARQMEQAAQDLDYESAVRLRDQISYLRAIQQQQVVDTHHGDCDILGIASQDEYYVIYVLQVRHGRLLGGKAYFPQVPSVSNEEEVLSAFMAQFYLQEGSVHSIPKEIIIPKKIQDRVWLLRTLTEQAHKKIKLTYKVNSEKREWVSLASENARQLLTSHLANKSTFYRQLESLQATLGLDNMPQRLECFDVSHTQGEATVAACVVFNQQGPQKADYRRFNISNVKAGDDYAALRQAITRRYKNLKVEGGQCPDILFIDGGKGQLSQAKQVLGEMQLNDILLIGVAKGPGRKAGLETLFLSTSTVPITLSANSLALQAVLALRNEAHRFAIVGHRNRRAKCRRVSPLESIAGIGIKRRRELLRQFGGLQALQAASIQDIAKIPGISITLAKRIYSSLKG